jgi:hypothetical protein
MGSVAAQNPAHSTAQVTEQVVACALISAHTSKHCWSHGRDDAQVGRSQLLDVAVLAMLVPADCVDDTFPADDSDFEDTDPLRL